MRHFSLLMVLIAAAASARAQSGEARDAFGKGYQLFASGKPAQAKEFLQKAADTSYRLADYSLYYLARIAFDEANWDQARKYLAQLRQRYPQSVWFHPAALLRAKVDIAEKQFAAAGETLRQLRAGKGVQREVADEAVYLQGQSQEAQGNFDRAYLFYQELRGAPGSRWSAAARKEQQRLRGKFPERFGLSTMEAMAEEADRLVRERQSGDAEELYKKILGAVSEPEQRLRQLSKLAALYLSTGNRNEAIPLLEQIARDFADNPEAGKALYQIGQIYWNRHDNARAFEYFKLVLEKYPSGAYTDRAQYAAADIHEFFGRKEAAIQLYAGLQKQFPKSPMRDDAMWRLAWLYYRSGDLAAAFTTFHNLAGQWKNGPFATAALYWQARVAEKSGDTEAALKLHRQIVRGGEESYYQTLSLRGLERLGAPLDDRAPAPPREVWEPDPPMGPELAFHLSRARELAALSLNQLALTELDEMSHNRKLQPPLRALLMREYFHNQDYRRSLSMANQLPAAQSERDLYRYPLAFWDLVRQKAQEKGLDPYLVLALIRQESLFDARARSPAAAFGLMQLIAPTASRVARQLGLPAPSQESLFDADTNVKLGTQYLKDLLQRYSNNWFKAIAAYNAGEGAVDRWEREILTDDIEEFVERIPYSETRGYVKLVLRNHRIYKRLYEPQK